MIADGLRILNQEDYDRAEGQNTDYRLKLKLTQIQDVYNEVFANLRVYYHHSDDILLGKDYIESNSATSRALYWFHKIQKLDGYDQNMEVFT